MDWRHFRAIAACPCNCPSVCCPPACLHARVLTYLSGRLLTCWAARGFVCRGEGGMDDATVAKVVETTTHQCMSSADHHARFDDHRIARAFAEINDLPWPRELTGKVRKTGGKSGEGSAKLAHAHRDAFAKAWSKVVSARLGFKDLRAMRAAWKKEQAAGPWGVFHLSGESNVILDAPAQ